MSEERPRCPQCARRSGSEVTRRFTLKRDSVAEAEATVHILWICDYCGHEWDTTSRRSWTDVKGRSARNPSELRARIDKYANKLYNRVFDYPPGSFRGDEEGMARLERAFLSALGKRFQSSLTTEIAAPYLHRARKKLLAHWHDPKDFKYYFREGINSERKGGSEGQ